MTTTPETCPDCGVEDDGANSCNCPPLVHFTPPGMPMFTWSTAATEETVAALITLGASPYSKIEDPGN